MTEEKIAILDGDDWSDFLDSLDTDTEPKKPVNSMMSKRLTNKEEDKDE
jgi:uncharacterized protein (DUF1778 family)